MSVCIFQKHKPTGYKIYQLHHPIEGTAFNEKFIYEILLQTLEARGIGPDKQPIELIDMAEYHSDNWLVQVIIFDSIPNEVV